MDTATRDADRGLTADVRDATSAPKRTPGVVWWAAIGAVFFAAEVYVLGKWVTGPYFKRVPTGPSDPPTWMKAELVLSQIISVGLALWLLYWFLYRPWRREKRITTDGLLVAACFLMAWQDPFCSYFNNWFTYNSWLPNFGSWAMAVPGWVSPQKPGAMIAEPIFITFWTYAWLWFGIAMIGCAMMRKAKSQWTRLTDPRLVALLFVFMILVDFIAEGVLFLPLGWFVYPGGHTPALFPDAYHKWPWHEGLLAAAWFTGLTCLRYFKNDKGQTVVERGVDTLRVSQRRKDLLRFFGLVGITNVIALASYNIPQAVMSARSGPWPKDVQSRSYFLDGLCGVGTDTACPAPGVPLPRGADSARLSPDGKLVVPPGTELPEPVPLRSGKAGPFNGGPF